jgi:hypothetical protein
MSLFVPFVGFNLISVFITFLKGAAANLPRSSPVADGLNDYKAIAPTKFHRPKRLLLSFTARRPYKGS